MITTAPQSSLSPREVARLSGVSADTLRHYEKKGLLPAPSRTASGYRRYSSDTVPRVQLIQRALVIGFSLGELARVLRERNRGVPPCRGVRDLVERRLADLELHLRQLSALQSELRQLIADWDDRLAKTAEGRPAHLLETLAGQPAIEQARALGATIKSRRRLRSPGSRS